MLDKTGSTSLVLYNTFVRLMPTLPSDLALTGIFSDLPDITKFCYYVLHSIAALNTVGVLELCVSVDVDCLSPTTVKHHTGRPYVFLIIIVCPGFSAVSSTH